MCFDEVRRVTRVPDTRSAVGASRDERHGVGSEERARYGVSMTGMDRDEPPAACPCSGGAVGTPGRGVFGSRADVDGLDEVDVPGERGENRPGLGVQMRPCPSCDPVTTVAPEASTATTLTSP